MVQEDRWREVHRMAREEQLPITEIARRLDLDRKTVRRCLKQADWQPYRRPARTDTLLVEHAEFLRERAPAVRYSAQVLYQELKMRGFGGGYDTVRRFVQPLRTAEALAAGRLLDIDLLDHVVIASGGYVSLRDRGVAFNRGGLR